MNKKPWWMLRHEWDLVESGEWELVHDGQNNPLQFKFPPKEVRYFTRKYRKKGKPWGGLVRSVTFEYDLRSRLGCLCRIEWVWEDSNHRKTKEAFELSEQRGRDTLSLQQREV